MDTWPQVRSTLSQIIHIFLRHAIVCKICYHLCVGTNNDISVSSVGHVDSHVSIAGNRIYRHGKKISCTLVQNNVIPLGTNHLIAADAQHIGNVAAAQSGAVHNPPGVEFTFWRRKYIISFAVPPYSCHFMVKIIRCSVGMGILSQGYGIIKRVHNSAVSRKHGKFPYHSRNQLMEPFFSN